MKRIQSMYAITILDRETLFTDLIHYLAEYDEA
jgi:hypothetical protein